MWRIRCPPDAPGGALPPPLPPRRCGRPARVEAGRLAYVRIQCTTKVVLCIHCDLIIDTRMTQVGVCIYSELISKAAGLSSKATLIIMQCIAITIDLI